MTIRPTRALAVAVVAATLTAAPGAGAPVASAAARPLAVRLSTPASVAAGAPCRVRVAVSRPVRGASVALQERTGARWRTLARRRLAGARSATLRCPAAVTAGRTRRFRAIVRRDGRIIATSRVVRVHVTPRLVAAVPPAAAPPAPAPPAGSGPSTPPRIDPAWFGAQGTGGPPTPEALALLTNPNVVLTATGVADIRAGRIDPRIAVVLARLATAHVITVGALCSDHAQFTAGGAVSPNWLGRGVDIAAIDGVLVGPMNTTARELAVDLMAFPPEVRPTEVGSPFVIPAPGYFTDASTQTVLHVAFVAPIDPSWTAPAG